MSERVRHEMNFDSCKVVTAGLVAWVISKSNALRFVFQAPEIKNFMETLVATVTVLYITAKTVAVVWTLWIRWKQRRNEKP